MFDQTRAWASNNQNPDARDHARMQQSGASIGQRGEGVSDASNQDNDHTSALGAEQQDATAMAGQTGWKTGDSLGQVRPGQSVVDADGAHLGTVASIDGDTIRLARADRADARRRTLAASKVDAVEGNEVRLVCRAEDLPG